MQPTSWLQRVHQTGSWRVLTTICSILRSRSWNSLDPGGMPWGCQKKWSLWRRPPTLKRLFITNMEIDIESIETFIRNIEKEIWWTKRETQCHMLDGFNLRLFQISSCNPCREVTCWRLVGFKSNTAKGLYFVRTKLSCFFSKHLNKWLQLLDSCVGIFNKNVYIRLCVCAVSCVSFISLSLDSLILIHVSVWVYNIKIYTYVITYMIYICVCVFIYLFKDNKW
jgi:hypothetical protein